ncbi:MAG TPA: hypothetical protein PLZ36_15980 [Armatimonadota bacterium]|nr:hypothetical protein [Armatimonadota bacterium]HOS43028.1 hypothetical protein [Armatimonadota bacterium]
MTRSVKQINAELQRLRKVKAAIERVETQDVVCEIGLLSLRRREANLVAERRALRERERACGPRSPRRAKRTARHGGSPAPTAPLTIAAKGL